MLASTTQPNLKIHACLLDGNMLVVNKLNFVAFIAQLKQTKAENYNICSCSTLGHY